MSSTMQRTPGGAFGKQHRFMGRHSTQTPGPVYNIPSLLTEHIQGPVYKAIPPKTTSAVDNSLPHPSKDRTAWLIGTTQNDLAYYSNIAAHMGPAFYSPQTSQTKSLSPRALFSKERRFTSLTNQYVSKEHNNANLCTASPGPKYMPGFSRTDLVSNVPPSYSFGSKGDSVSDRSSFIHAKVQDGYLYAAKPATSENTANVGPANYSPRPATVKNMAPRPVWTKADRFRNMDKVFISRKHSRAKQGNHSPGPMYYPKNYDMGNIRGRGGQVPSGKWCP